MVWTILMFLIVLFVMLLASESDQHLKSDKVALGFVIIGIAVCGLICASEVLIYFGL